MEKAQLRYVQLLETAQKLNLTGDIARTIDAPANQLRILKHRLYRQPVHSVTLEGFSLTQTIQSVLSGMKSGLNLGQSLRNTIWDEITGSLVGGWLGLKSGGLVGGLIGLVSGFASRRQSKVLQVA